MKKKNEGKTQYITSEMKRGEALPWKENSNMSLSNEERNRRKEDRRNCEKRDVKK